MCQHLKIRDLGKFYQCEDCGLTARKQTYQECLDRLEKMRTQVEEIALYDIKKATKAMERVNAIYDDMILELTIKKG